MISITNLCKRRNKLPANFLTTKACRGRTDITVVYGSTGGTSIPDDLIPQFLMWLAEDTKQMVLDGHSPKEVLQYLQRT